MQAALARNLRLYPWYLASSWEGVSNAVWFLYLYSYKGLSLEQMAWLALLGDGIIVLAEVPTGWLADRIGRRRSLLIGIFLQALSAVLFIYGGSFFSFWLAMATCGLGDTFRSGADEALLFDSCLATGQQPRYRPVLAGAMFISTLVMVVSQIGGGAIAHYVSWELPFWLEVGFSTSGFIAVLLMVEAPRHAEPEPDPEPRSTDAATRPRRFRLWLPLIPLLAFAMLLEALPELAHFHLPAELNSELDFTPLHLGVIYAVFELLQGLGNKLAARLKAHTALRALAWGTAGMLVCFALLGTRAWLGLAVYLIGRGGIDLLYGLADPLISEEANLRTVSSVRATALSVVNAGKRLLPLGLLPLSALLVERTSYAPAYGIMLAAIAVPLLISVPWLLAGASRTARESG
jgi:MFS family permease